MTNVYNIIWADDEIDSFRMDRITLSIMKSQNVQLLDYAHNSTELREKLKEWEDIVDAVVTDGNFDKKRIVDINQSTSGLSDVLSFINEFNRKRFIPFFLYTGKGDMLKDKFTDGELDYFEKRNRIFEKGYFVELLQRIKSDVDHINSPQFQLRNKYTREFEAAKLIEEATDNMEKGLLYLYEDSSWKDTQDYFNPARKIVERIIDSCISMNLLPPHISLNTASKILGGNTKDFSLATPLMEKPLAESLRYFLSITQDGSHDMYDLQLGVDQYVRRTANVNLYLSILHIAMDLLLWHKDMKNKYNGNSNRLWTANFEFMGNVCVHPKWSNIYYTDKYQLDNNNGLLKVGDLVGIRKGGGVPNNNTGLKPAITDYVKETNYIVL